MFASHAGLALAVRPLMPRQSLGLLFAAATQPDGHQNRRAAFMAASTLGLLGGAAPQPPGQPLL